jgi:DNA-binding Lrp family transcriptional regulator
MNLLEQQILDLIQDAFPLVERPYKALAEMLNVSELEAFEAVERLRASGVIRRIGGVYDSQKLGFISRLCAGKVPASSFDFSAEPHEQTAMEKFAAAVKEVPAITHNYIRSHEYNVWFTVIAQNENEIQTIVDKLCAITDLHDVHVMSATRKFKINTVMALDDNCERRESRPTLLDMTEPNSLASKGKDERGERSGTAAAPVDSRPLAVGREGDERGSERHSDNRRLEESDKSRIRTACEDIPHSLTPFNDWGVSCDELREDIASKRMRRFGAILCHQNAGFAFNAMVCFRIVDSRKSDKCEDRESHPCLHGYDRDQHLGSIQVGRGSNVILSGEAAKDPVKSCDLIAQAGSLLASNQHISHCYERPSFEGLPYNVYAMMHANSAEQLNQYIADCVKALNALQSSPVDYVVLRSVQELKKTSFKFFA